MSIVYRQRVAILAAMMVVGALIISPHIGIASPSPLVTGSLNASYSTSGQPASFSTSSSATY